VGAVRAGARLLGGAARFLAARRNSFIAKRAIEKRGFLRLRVLLAQQVPYLTMDVRRFIPSIWQ